MMTNSWNLRLEFDRVVVNLIKGISRNHFSNIAMKANHVLALPCVNLKIFRTPIFITTPWQVRTSQMKSGASSG